MKDTWDDYLIEGTNILKNKFNISNKEELLQKEKEEVVLEELFVNKLEINPCVGCFSCWKCYRTKRHPAPQAKRSGIRFAFAVAERVELARKRQGEEY